MERKLYSELRTIYETTAADPHTFRLTIKLKDLVDGAVLRRAVDAAMERYPYFRVRLAERDGELLFADNPAPVPVLETKHRITLGGAQAAGHLLAFCWWKNRLYIDAYHGLTDGGGIAPLVKTLLYYYCSFYYETPLPAEGVRLRDGAAAPEEWADPALSPLPEGPRGLVSKWSEPAFQLTEGGRIRLIPEGVVYNLRVPEAAFMGFNLSHDGSPASIVALLLARTVAALHPEAARPPVIAMCVNQRRALRAPLAHQSLVGDVRLPYTARLGALPFPEQVTCFRGMVTLQTDEGMVLDEIRDYQALMAELKGMDGHGERQARCRARMEALSRCFTATVSYVGKAELGEAERFIQEYEALPSTALPSTHVPLTVEMSAVNGYFFLNFIQYFHETDYFSAFIRQLRENGLDYDVLNVAEARYPRVELPI